MKKPKPRCKSCNDETSFPSNCNGMREKLEWCVSCFRVSRGGRGANERQRTIADGTPYDSRPPRG